MGKREQKFRVFMKRIETSVKAELDKKLKLLNANIKIYEEKQQFKDMIEEEQRK